MRGGEGQDVALAGNGLGLEEARFKIYMKLEYRGAGRKGYLDCVAPSLLAPS
jgi:hypothetical protein